MSYEEKEEAKETIKRFEDYCRSNSTFFPTHMLRDVEKAKELLEDA